MINHQKTSAEFVQDLIQKSGMPRNQIAALSGLSNAYIKELEAGNIKNVGRNKLIALAVALSLDLPMLDKLLAVFERTGITSTDIPTLMAVPNRSRLSSAPLPLRGFFITDLFVTAQEKIPGRQQLVSVWPTYALLAEGHRSYMDRREVSSHPVHEELFEAIRQTRRQAIVDNLSSHFIDQYLCRHCLERYIEECDDPKELAWRKEHIENVIAFIKKYDKFRIFLVNRCPTFIINLKTPDPDSKWPQRLTLSNSTKRHVDLRHPDQIAGFITQSKAFIDVFNQELINTEQAIDDAYLERSRLIKYLQQLISA